MKLEEFTRVLGEVAPLELAADWDNVGLLVEPLSPKPIRSVLLAIDLTPAVLEEAAERKVNLIVAYHPPVFHGLKRFAGTSSEAWIVRFALGKGIAIYSPHTALDAAPGGVNDWLIQAFGKGKVRSLVPHLDRDANAECKLVTFLPERDVAKLRDALDAAGLAGRIGEYQKCSYEITGRGTFQGSSSSNPTVGEAGRFERVDEVRLEMVCAGGEQLAQVSELIHAVHPYETPAWDVYRLEPKPRPAAGQGRFIELATPQSLAALVPRVKRHLGLRHVRVAASLQHEAGTLVSSVAVCPGAGGSVLSGVRADLLLTGEMRHHDLLAATARGTSVILTDHTNSERGYLPVLRTRLRARTQGVAISISERDREPLRVA